MPPKKTVKKKETEKKVSKKAKKEQEKKNNAMNKQQNTITMWIIIFMVTLIVSFLGVTYFKENYYDNFNHIGLRFTRSKLDKLKIFTVDIPVEKEGYLIGHYSAIFRNDPRKTSQIPLELHDDKLSFRASRTVYITINSSINKCANTNVAVLTFSDLLTNFAKLKLESGISDKAYALEHNISYVTCANKQYYTVINIESGLENKVMKKGEGCYYITFKDCDLDKVTERFNLELLERYMNFFNEKIKDK